MHQQDVDIPISAKWHGSHIQGQGCQVSARALSVYLFCQEVYLPRPDLAIQQVERNAMAVTLAVRVERREPIGKLVGKHVLKKVSAFVFRRKY